LWVVLWIVPYVGLCVCVGGGVVGVCGEPNIEKGGEEE
jgi:hypothetical protein